MTWEVAKAYLDGLALSGVSNGTYNPHLTVLRYIFKTLREQAQSFVLSFRGGFK